MLIKTYTLTILLSILSVSIALSQQSSTPYSPGANRRALDAIGSRSIALYPVSRYAYVHGYKVRLSDRDLLRGEAFFQDDKLYIPSSFAGVLQLKSVSPQPIPKGLEVLKERWVYTLERPQVKLPADIPQNIFNGEPYFSVTDYARQIGYNVYSNPTGLVIISRSPIVYNGTDSVTAECVTALFDTPEKYMNPDIATRYIPYLRNQGSWTTHASITPEQLELINNGTEKEWNTVPKSDYDYSGVNQAIIGSAVPVAGVYPRLLFSPQDLPMLRLHIKSNASAMKSMVEIEYLLGKTWLDPTTSDGRVFDLLANGNLKEIRKNMEQPQEGRAVYHVGRLTTDHKPGIYSSHINYVTNCLTTMSLYAMLTDNDALGKKCADAIVTYFRLYEPNVERHLATTDSQFGVDFDGASHSSTHWRGMHGVIPHMDMAFALDFSGKWMSPEQKLFMRNLIAKATYGRRTGGGDGSRRAWRDINHVSWHLTHLICIAAIEGTPGFDPEAYASGAEVTRDFLDWGIDRNGQIFESNGKTGGGNEFQWLSMIVLARRGDNLWGHPHLRKLLEAQTLITTPNGERTVTSGTWSGGPLEFKGVAMLKCMYPENRFADYLMTNSKPDFDPLKFDPTAYMDYLRKNNPQTLRLTGPTYPGLDGLFGFPYIADWRITRRSDLDIKLNWDTDEYGMFSASSDNTAEAVWMNMQVRSNHYIGAGHHHSDLGMFHFSALGVNWFAESPLHQEYNSKYHNAVLIDGIAESDKSPAKADYLGADTMSQGAFAAADLTYAYSWKWCTQVSQWGIDFSSPTPGLKYSDGMYTLETRPEILNIFRGTGRYKMRPWWATSNQSNFIATLKTPWNPVEYVFRTTGLVRGTHSYGIVSDDIKKDNSEHDYSWTAALGTGVWANSAAAPYPNSVLLAYDADIPANGLWKISAPSLDPITPAVGTPMLLVYLAGARGDEKFNIEVTDDAPVGRDGKPQYYARMTIDRRGVDARYRLIMIPVNYGEEYPAITESGSTVEIRWNEQTDRIEFLGAADKRTRVVVKRNGDNVVAMTK